MHVIAKLELNIEALRNQNAVPEILKESALGLALRGEAGAEKLESLLAQHPTCTVVYYACGSCGEGCARVEYYCGSGGSAPDYVEEQEC